MKNRALDIGASITLDGMWQAELRWGANVIEAWGSYETRYAAEVAAREQRRKVESVAAVELERHRNKCEAALNNNDLIKAIDHATLAARYERVVGKNHHLGPRSRAVELLESVMDSMEQE